MEFENTNLIEYFKYDLEKLLDEFNNFYAIRQAKIPVHIQVLYLYFSHLAENSLQLLINSKYNIHYAIDITIIPGIYIKPYSEEEINQFLQNSNLKEKHFYGLAGFSLYFFEMFLNYVKYENENSLSIFFKNIPIIEKNLSLIHHLV